MPHPFLSQIALFTFAFPPRGWATCSGQLLPINQNQALFALLGTTYGGNGKTTFALPDLRGRAPLGFGQGAGLDNYDLGQVGGTERVTPTTAQLPQHTHPVDASGLHATARCKNGLGDRQTPVGSVPAIDGGTASYSNLAPDADMRIGGIAGAGSMTATFSGGGQSHDNLQPYLPLTYCIALQGTFPSQS